jgi:RimJ/RimL family protein N-acetyltransferase
VSRAVDDWLGTNSSSVSDWLRQSRHGQFLDIFTIFFAMQAIIQTPRLTLILLTTTTPGSKHVNWFHENWSDPDATAWALHGPCKTIEESREWMIEQRTKHDILFYAVFAKKEGTAGTEEDPGVHVGSVSLRRQSSGPTLSPPEPLEGASGVKIDMRVLGYAFFKTAWGNGYATEANKALLAAYAAFATEEKKELNRVHYVEASADEENPGSQAVLRKIGFTRLGWKTETERVFLAGAWREGGYWVYGQYI